MKKLMILGAGSCQLNAIRRIQTLGYNAVVSDYKEESPGKMLSDFTVLADTFSYEETLEGAKRYQIDGIMTTGTDQPVWTASKVAESLDLFSFLDVSVALSVTNKKVMKEKFRAINIPTVDFQYINCNSDIVLEPPYVMKPLDSQGQRGIYKIEHKEDVMTYLDKSLSYSKLDEVLLESYYKNKEVTVSGWVKNSEVFILTITDRVTFNSDEHIGVCISHEYPSIHQEHIGTLTDYTHQICEGFKIKNGPIYFQFLIGDDGVKVNEIACRIGGAYEDLTIPYITGVDILKMQIQASVNEPYTLDYKPNSQVFSTQLFFCKQGEVSYISNKKMLLEHDFILDVGFNYKIGDVIGETENASQRAGYMIVTATTEEELVINIEKAYDLLVMRDKSKNLVIRGKRYYR